jgi:hypothetical protein
MGKNSPNLVTLYALDKLQEGLDRLQLVIWQLESRWQIYYLRNRANKTRKLMAGNKFPPPFYAVTVSALASPCRKIPCNRVACVSQKGVLQKSKVLSCFSLFVTLGVFDIEGTNSTN